MTVQREVGVVLVLVVAAMLSIGCTGKSPVTVEPGEIPGTWDLTGVSSTSGGQTYTAPAEQIAADPLTRVFLDDGSGVEHYQGVATPFSWSADGTNLTLRGSTSLVFQYVVNATTMTLSFDEPDNGTVYRVTHTFTRR